MSDPTYELATEPPRRPPTVRIAQDLWPATPPVAPRPSKRKRLGRFAIAMASRLLVALFVCGVAVWALIAGLNIRADTWRYSRIMRFHPDIANASYWGNRALAEMEADARAAHDPFPSSRPGVLQGPMDVRSVLRRLGGQIRIAERIFHGLVPFYDRRVAESPDQEYELDYPPLRLTVMTYWIWCVHADTGITVGWQGQPMPYRDPRTHEKRWVTEAIAQPLLNMNSAFEAAAAVGMFFLVRYWVRRSARTPSPGTHHPHPSPLPEYRERGQGAARFALPHGLFIFLVATLAFWYCVSILMQPCPIPGPAVALEAPTNVTDSSATLRGVVAPQGSPTRWQFEWGTTSDLGKVTPPAGAGNGGSAQEIEASISPLTGGQTIYYRLVARSPSGLNRTAMSTFTVGAAAPPPPPAETVGIVWPAWWTWIALLALFLIVVTSARGLPVQHRAWACGLTAALMIWFNPGILAVAHAWPQWDAWVLPAFIFATLLASVDWWMLAGVVIAIGAMLKGQTALGAPVLLLWPLFGARFGAAMRFLAGVALGAGLLVWPWIVDRPIVLAWIGLVLSAAVIAGAIALLRRPALEMIGRRRGRGGSELQLPATLDGRSPAGLAVLLIGCLVIVAGAFVAEALMLRAWPAPARAGLSWSAAGWMVILVIAVPWVLPRRAALYWPLIVFAFAIWTASILFNSNYSWLWVGFEYGTRKHHQVAMGVGSFTNLASLLNVRFGWNLEEVATTLCPPNLVRLLHLHGSAAALAANLHLDGVPWELGIREVLALVYFALLAVCAAAAAMHARRNDPRVLIALAAPWVILVALLTQMGQRYLLWPAVFTSAAVAVSGGLSLLSVLLSLLCVGMTTHQMMAITNGRPRSPLLYDFFSGVYPGGGWMLLLIAAIFLYVAVTPGRRRRDRIDLSAVS